MKLDSIINDDTITEKIQDIYKYIEKHDDQFDDIIDFSFEDIRNIYKDVKKVTDYIEIPSVDPDDVFTARDKCNSILNHHGEKILGDKKHLIQYAFKINIIGNMVQIIKKH